MILFNTYMKLHHSQTNGKKYNCDLSFNTYMKLHHSQTAYIPVLLNLGV